MKPERKLINGEWWEKIELPQETDYIQTQSIQVENYKYIFRFTMMWDNVREEWYKEGYLSIETNGYKNELVDLWDNHEYLLNILETFSTEDDNEFFEENSIEIYTVLKMARDKGWI